MWEVRLDRKDAMVAAILDDGPEAGAGSEGGKYDGAARQGYASWTRSRRRSTGMWRASFRVVAVGGVRSMLVRSAWAGGDDGGGRW